MGANHSTQQLTRDAESQTSRRRVFPRTCPDPSADSVFGGMGSMGNGAAMRVAPLGAYWADDYSTVVEQARLSADVTHAHADGQTGNPHNRCRKGYADRFFSHRDVVIPDS